MCCRMTHTILFDYTEDLKQTLQFILMDTAEMGKMAG